tara:strand:+ start:1168 stop:1332 length:165 start_codon:yes stop_codon:yes gene_type:complete
MDAKKLSYGVVIVGVVQLILGFMGGAGIVDYILAILVVILGGMLAKGGAAPAAA